MSLNDARPKNTQQGDFSEEPAILQKVHEQLWNQRSTTKEEHIIITCLSACISKIGSDGAAVCS